MALTLTFNALVLLVVCFFATKAEKCLPGDFHKANSGRANEAYKVCQAWSNDTCCTANFTNELYENQVESLYNLKWGHCKNLSQECEKYILAEECFFSCEPTLIKWHTGTSYYIRSVPVCGDYCNDWYEACKNDQTCVVNWFSLNYTSSTEDCPKNSKCQTFEQIYGSGKNLCNKMWGTTFVYADPKKCPCTRLDKPVPAGVDNMSTCSGVMPVAIHFLSYSILVVYLGLAIK